MRTRQERSQLVDCGIEGLLKSTYEERSGAGAISTAVLTSYWTSTGASQALTLADGEEGQFKIIIHAVDGGSLVITPTNFAAAAPSSVSISLVAAGDNILLQFVKGNWWLLGFGTHATLTGNTIVFA